jgi:hypothetical protein
MQEVVGSSPTSSTAKGCEQSVSDSAALLLVARCDTVVKAESRLVAGLTWVSRGDLIGRTDDTVVLKPLGVETA